MAPEMVKREAQPVPWPKPWLGTHLALTGVLGLKNSWVTRVAYHETAVKVQRPKDKERAQLCPRWPPRAQLPAIPQRMEKEPEALTRQEEEGTPRDGDTALGDGVAVSNPGALHADDTEDHAHKAQEDSHHHQGSCRLDVTWVGRRG